MKKRIREIVICTLITLVIFVALGIAGHYETHYTMQGTVVNTNGALVTIDTEDGHRWQFYGTGYSVNDWVQVEMFNGGTDLEKCDDEITGVKKIS